MKNKTQKGYALLVTVVVISIIMLIATGLSNSTYKQLILSSSARDSQAAFYQADTASECALYAEYQGAIFKEKDPITQEVIINTTPASTFSCGGQEDMTVTHPDSNGSYSINPLDETSNDPCFRIDVVKDGVYPNITITMTAKGYNICDTSSLRTVERTIEISYGGDASGTPPDSATPCTLAIGDSYKGGVIANIGSDCHGFVISDTRIRTDWDDAMNEADILSVDGDNWWLPDMTQLRLIYKNKATIGGNFYEDPYWSSEVHNISYARYIQFSFGAEGEAQFFNDYQSVFIKDF